MMGPGHYQMAKALLKIAPSLVDRDQFLRGSIYPDISLKHMFKFHTYEVSRDYLKSLLDQLFDPRLDIEIFSFKLGEALHYIMDYFCKYHQNKDIFLKLGHHLFYEIWLLFSFNIKLRSTTLSSVSRHYVFLIKILWRYFDKDITADDLITFIEYRISRYERNTDKHKDLKFAIHTAFMCMTLITFNRSIAVK